MTNINYIALAVARDSYAMAYARFANKMGYYFHSESEHTDRVNIFSGWLTDTENLYFSVNAKFCDENKRINNCNNKHKYMLELI